MVACGEKVQHMFQFSHRHVQEKDGCHDIIRIDHTAAGWHQQIQGCGYLEQCREAVGQIVIRIGKVSQIPINQPLDKKTKASESGNSRQGGQEIVYTLVIDNPLIEEIKERQHKNEHTGENADMEQDAQRV